MQQKNQRIIVDRLIVRMGNFNKFMNRIPPGTIYKIAIDNIMN